MLNNTKPKLPKYWILWEYYNLNALIFHVRPFNDALYRSKLNPWSSYLVGFGVDPDGIHYLGLLKKRINAE